MSPTLQRGVDCDQGTKSGREIPGTSPAPPSFANTAPPFDRNERIRIDPDPTGPEFDMLSQYLEYQRGTITSKTAGLTREQLAQKHPHHAGHTDFLREAIDGTVSE
jgi:hypothetical protein